MHYKPSLWDDSEPLYAPNMDATHPRLRYWKVPSKYRKLGYKPTSIRLAGEEGDGLDEQRAAEARKHTRDMLRHFGLGQDSANHGTWQWLFDRFRADPYSSYNTVSAASRDGYDYTLGKWAAAIGKTSIESLTYERIQAIRAAMDNEGRSASYIRRLFTTLRTLTKYGCAIQAPGAVAVRDTLAAIRLKGAPRRAVAPEASQILAIIAEANKRGWHAVALGLSFQWTYALRAVDVRGKWEPDDGYGGIVHNGKRWSDGLTWDMFDSDLTSFTKVMSKTRDSMPEPMRFELTEDLRAKLERIDNRVGPVILNRDGRPYTKYSWSQAFRRIREDLGLPSSVKMMDTRAAALTDAKERGADPFQLRDAGQHLHVETTDGYARRRSDNANKVVKLRGLK